jgi:DNA-binding Xre family transcriptional regulator
MKHSGLFFSQPKTFTEADQKRYQRENLILNTTEDLLIAMEERGISKADLAARLSKTKSCISQMLSGKRNMTLRTLSDICFELGIEPHIDLGVGVDECFLAGEAIVDDSVADITLEVPAASPRGRFPVVLGASSSTATNKIQIRVFDTDDWKVSRHG